MEERYRGSHRERKIKREVGLGERKRDRSEREIEREPQKKRHGGREEDRNRYRGWKRERQPHRGRRETGVRER